METADCGGLQLDSTKVTVNFAAWGYTGVEVGELFREARVAVELVDAYNVLFLVTYADVTTDYDEALARIAVGAGCRKNLRRAGELLSAGNTGTAAGRAGNRRNYCLLPCAEGAWLAGKRTCGQQLTNDTYYCGLR